ncbi:MAG: helix-turn-helix domain-containing protein [Amaricoccus sp.]
MTVQEVANALGVPEQKIQELVDNGELIGVNGQYDSNQAQEILQTKEINKWATKAKSNLDLLKKDRIIQNVYAQKWPTILSAFAACSSAVTAIFAYCISSNAFNQSNAQFSELSRRFQADLEYKIRSDVSDSKRFLDDTIPSFQLSLSILQDRLIIAKRIQDEYMLLDDDKWEFFSEEICSTLREGLCKTSEDLTISKIASEFPELANFCFSTELESDKLCKK